MWYVVQVKSGEEQEMKMLLDRLRKDGAYGECFVPLFEDVKRSGGKCRIGFRKLFPGYVFVESDDPQKVFETLREIKDFTKLLGAVEADGSKIFIPIGKEDEEFMRTLFVDGLMHVSYVHMAKSGRIDRIVGPLAHYRNHITKLELRHRMAIVEAEMFGKRRKVKFGLWTDDDPLLPLTQRLKDESTPDDVLDGVVEIDLGIHPGDKVVDDTGVYGDQVFVVKSVDAKHRTLISTFEMFGTSARIELCADAVRKV
jgi:transcription antitermination factor NusG